MTVQDAGRRPAVVTSSTAELKHVVDVVVVGSGAGGHAAALAAARDGATVAIVEKREQVGGTTAKSGGWYWMPNNRWMRELGTADHKDDALRYMARLTRPEAYDPAHATLGLQAWEHALIETFYDHAAETADLLVELDALTGVHAADFPDYFAQLPENRAPKGRVLIPAAEDGGLGTGADMIRQLSAAAARLGVETLTGHAVEQLVRDEHGVSGVVASNGAERVAIAARRAVVFASGGYGQSATLRRELLAGPVFGSCAAPGCTGDFLRIAAELGAPLRSTGHPWMSPCVLERALRNRADLEMTFQAPGDSMLEVNRRGARAMNEKLQYNEQTLMHWAWDAQRAEYGNLLMFMVWDEACQALYESELPGNPIAPAGRDDGHVVRAQTLPQLAQALAQRLAQLAPQTGGATLDERFAERLAASVARFNANAREGHDPDFHRGETPIERFFDSLHGAAREGGASGPTMHPLSDDGPYYATIIAPGMLDSKGGPMTDPSGRVLDGDGEPIPRLYGVGNCVASPSGRAYWAGGATLGPALTFGMLAGSSAAREPLRAAPEGAVAAV
ncbi:MAG TPA: FAD-dependent oxidoreductase [Conexibacter sp.]|jgi:succinate dehydrogenase/fumarate reductase flavoprotein subunit